MRVLAAGSPMIALLLLLTAASVPGCARKVQAAPQATSEAGEVAATVNGEPIYLSDVALEAVAQGLVSAGDPFGPGDTEYRLVLDQLIDQKLMAQEARRRGLGQDPASRRRLEMAAERIMGNLLVESLVAEQVTDEAIDRMYAEQVSLQQIDDEVLIAHILVGSQEEAEALHARIARGETFESLVFNHSKDRATRLENGEIGWVRPNAQPPPFPQMIAETPEGSVSPPFETEEGWHILKVKDRRSKAPKTREEMRPEIASFLTLNEVSRILRKLRTEAKIATETGEPYLPAGEPAVRGSGLSGDEL